MSTASERSIHALEHVVKGVPVGTNLALLHLLWAMLSGAFLKSRGAVFPALQFARFTTAQIRRSGQALRSGARCIGHPVQAWRTYVHNQGQWQPRSYEGYRPVAVDLVAFWRPRLKGQLGRFFHSIAKRLMKGIGFGLVVEVGQIGEQRVPLLRRIIRPQDTQMDDHQLKQRALRTVAQALQAHDVLVHDAGASTADMQAAGVPRYAAVLPPLPTGFWDRRPNRTPGRLRRVLAQGGFPEDYPLDGRIRENAWVTAHLPKGIEAHRRQKAA